MTIRDAAGNTNVDYLQVEVSPPGHDYVLMLISIGFIFLVIWVIHREMTLRALKRTRKRKTIYSITEFLRALGCLEIHLMIIGRLVYS